MDMIGGSVIMFASSNQLYYFDIEEHLRSGESD